MTDFEILRAALRDYQDAATDAYCAYRPEESGTEATFGRYLALARIADEIQRIVAIVYQRDQRGEPTPTTSAIVSSCLGTSTLREVVAAAVRVDLFLRLCRASGQIPECLR